jgi:cyclic nucleotide gated channel
MRLGEWRLKRRETKEWMRHLQLPYSLRELVRRFVQYKWLATSGVDEESILRSYLRTDLCRDIQRHLCLELVRRVKHSRSSILKSIFFCHATLANVFPICRFLFFSQMDDKLLDPICGRLVSCLSAQGNYI